MSACMALMLRLLVVVSRGPTTPNLAVTQF